MKRIWLLMLATPFHLLAMDTVRLDLKPHWLSFYENQFVPFNGTGDVIYLRLSECHGEALEISSKNPFSVFLNSHMIRNDVKEFYSSIQDLKSREEPGMIAIYSDSNVDRITCSLLQVAHDDKFANKKSEVSNFIILVGIFLVSCFIVLLRTQPTLTVEYLNVPRIFGSRSTEEKLNLRITSVSNLFFYLLSSSITATIIFVFVNGHYIVDMDLMDSLVSVLLLICILFGLLLIKALWMKGLAMLFRLEDFSSGQFQDYPKIWFISFGLCGLLLGILAMLGVAWANWIHGLEYFVVTVHLIFVGAVFMKLLGRGGFTAFHLFSYLCATEIIPFIILLNVYFF